MTRREQELIDQFRAWREQAAATPEQPWLTEPPEFDLDPREQRLAEARERRAKRLARPASSPEPSPSDAPAPATLTRVDRYDTVITRGDAEFARWKRKRPQRQYGRTRGGRFR